LDTLGGFEVVGSILCRLLELLLVLASLALQLLDILVKVLHVAHELRSELLRMLVDLQPISALFIVVILLIDHTLERHHLIQDLLLHLLR